MNAGYLQDFIDGIAVHELLVAGGLVKSTAEGVQWHQLFNTQHYELAVLESHDPVGSFSYLTLAHHPLKHNAAWPTGEFLWFPPHQLPNAKALAVFILQFIIGLFGGILVPSVSPHGLRYCGHNGASGLVGSCTAGRLASSNF